MGEVRYRDLELEVDLLKKQLAAVSMVSLHNARPSWPKVASIIFAVVTSAGGIVWTLSAQVAAKATAADVDESRRLMTERQHQTEVTLAKLMEKLAEIGNKQDSIRVELTDLRRMMSFGRVRSSR